MNVPNHYSCSVPSHNIIDKYDVYITLSEHCDFNMVKKMASLMLIMGSKLRKTRFSAFTLCIDAKLRKSKPSNYRQC